MCVAYGIVCTLYHILYSPARAVLYYNLYTLHILQIVRMLSNVIACVKCDCDRRCFETLCIHIAVVAAAAAYLTKIRNAQQQRLATQRQHSVNKNARTRYLRRYARSHLNAHLRSPVCTRSDKRGMLYTHVYLYIYATYYSHAHACTLLFDVVPRVSLVVVVMSLNCWCLCVCVWSHVKVVRVCVVCCGLLLVVFVAIHIHTYRLFGILLGVLLHRCDTRPLRRLRLGLRRFSGQKPGAFWRVTETVRSHRSAFLM